VGLCHSLHGRHLAGHAAQRVALVSGRVLADLRSRLRRRAAAAAATAAATTTTT
jgi:hypothetical protein